MPPAKGRNVQDDSRSEASSTKEKHSNAASNNSKSRRATNGNAGSSLKDVAIINSANVAAVAASNATQESGPGVRLLHV